MAEVVRAVVVTACFVVLVLELLTLVTRVVAVVLVLDAGVSALNS
jgi:hypothetical protein